MTLKEALHNVRFQIAVNDDAGALHSIRTALDALAEFASAKAEEIENNRVSPVGKAAYYDECAEFDIDSID